MHRRVLDVAAGEAHAGGDGAPAGGMFGGTAAGEEKGGVGGGVVQGGEGGAQRLDALVGAQGAEEDEARLVRGDPPVAAGGIVVNVVGIGGVQAGVWGDGDAARAEGAREGGGGFAVDMDEVEQGGDFGAQRGVGAGEAVFVRASLCMVQSRRPPRARNSAHSARKAAASAPASASSWAAA